MKKEMNNKGFSLVELIIVIAIMAILIVVLAPQYLKYVERSRNSTDITNATEIVSAIQVYAADPEAATPFEAGKAGSVTVGTSGAISGDNSAAITAALTNAGITIADRRCSSKSKWTEYTITATAQANGEITFTYSQTGGTDTSAFENAMKGKTGS